MPGASIRFPRRLDLAIDPSSLSIGFIAGTLGRGGAERQLIYMLRALQNEGVSARILCLTRGEAFEQEVLDLGIKVDWVGETRNRFMRLKKIISNLRETPVDVVQSAHFYTNIYAAAAGKVLNVPSIGAIRNDLTSEIAANGVFGKWQLSLPCLQIVNSTSAFERAIARGYSKERMFLVRNVVSATVDLKSRTNRSKTRLLFVGRLVEQKRPELFVDLACHLRRFAANEELEFVVAGDGPLRLELEHRAKAIGLQNDQIKFLGEQTAMTDVYRNSDVLISTSAHEGTPNVILEAMAYGIPVVATGVGGVTDILAEGRGLLVKPGDMYGLVLASERLIGDKSLRKQLGEAGKKYVVEHHSTAGLHARLLEIYSKLTRGPRIDV